MNIRYVRLQILIIVLIVGVTAMGGCAVYKGSMEPFVDLRIHVPRRQTIQALGQPSKDGNPELASFNKLTIDISEASPFVFTFPDGYSVISSQLDATTIKRHMNAVGSGRNLSYSEMVDGHTRYAIGFSVDENGAAYYLFLTSCKYTVPRVLGTLAHPQSFDFPIKRWEIGKLFGQEMEIINSMVLMGLPCDAS